MPSIAALAAALVLALAACDRRVEPWVPPDQEPPAAERPVRMPGLSRPESRVAPLGRSPAAPGAGGDLRGRIVLGAGVEANEQGTLFVIARGPEPGPPLAVKRLPAGPFPLEFSLGAGDVMIPGREFRGPIVLSARLDLDGNPLTREPGGLAAQLDAPVEPGTSDLELVLR